MANPLDRDNRTSKHPTQRRKEAKARERSLSRRYSLLLASSENIRWNGKQVIYNLSKPNYKGQRSIQLDPIEFIDRIAFLIPIPHRHRRRYFGVFAPNSPFRRQVVANAGRNPEDFVPPPLRIQSEKVCKVSLEWAALIARIYEVNPLICVTCGGIGKNNRFCYAYSGNI